MVEQRRRRRLAAPAVLMTVILAGCAGSGPEHQAESSLSKASTTLGREDPSSSVVGRVGPGLFGRQNGKIAFTSNRGGSKQIWVMNADGSNQTQLTSAFHAAQLPAWSRDGTKIAFVGTWDCPGCAYTGRPYTDQLYVMNADGSNQRLVTTEWFANRRLVSNENAPTWSADGQLIAFQGHSNFNQPLYKPPYVIRADGSGLNRLPDGLHNMDWSPDGTRFVYDFNGRGIRITNAPASSFGGDDVAGTPTSTQLTGSPGDRDASWSLDGHKIVFNRSPLGDGSAPNVFVMNADGSAMTDLTGNSADQLPVWSPDGAKIAFSAQGDANNEDILVMNPDGTGRTRLTTDGGLDYQPSWQLGKRWFAEPGIDLPLAERPPVKIGSQAVAPALGNAACLFGLDLPWTC